MSGRWDLTDDITARLRELFAQIQQLERQAVSSAADYHQKCAALPATPESMHTYAVLHRELCSDLVTNGSRQIRLCDEMVDLYRLLGTA